MWLYCSICDLFINHLCLSVTPLQKGKTTTDYTDFSLEEIRVICEIRGKASSCSRVIRDKKTQRSGE